MQGARILVAECRRGCGYDFDSPVESSDEAGVTVSVENYNLPVARQRSEGPCRILEDHEPPKQQVFGVMRLCCTGSLVMIDSGPGHRRKGNMVVQQVN